MNLGSVVSEIASAVKAGDTDLLAAVSSMTGSLSKNPTIPQLVLDGGELLAMVASKYPNPEVQLVAGIASAILTEVKPFVAAAAATPAAAPK